MQRTKVFAIAAALVAATAATVVLAGSASAAQWHVYKGDMFAGHAYGLEVPKGSESVEFLLDGADTASASLGVYSPGGKKIGYYELGNALDAASIANPEEGRYVVYVYDVTDGALTVRVNSDKEPELDLVKVALTREDVKIGTFEEGKLDQVVTQTLKTPPVFVTLLYEGSARDLDATVSSQKGAVVTIVDETATAFSPGVWTSLKGERTFDAANLDGASYTVEVHAAQFEGDMILTTLALDLAAPATPMPFDEVMPWRAGPDHHEHGRAHKEHAGHSKAQAGIGSSAAFALEPETAVAFSAPAGKLLLMDPVAGEPQSGDEDGCQYVHGVVAIYAPDDSLLGVVVLDHDKPAAEIDLPVSGEYVAYTHSSESEVILAKIDGMRAAPTMRKLDLATEELTFSASAFLLSANEAQEFTLEHAPVALALRASEGSYGTLSQVVAENENGAVASFSGLAILPEVHAFSWSDVEIENFAAGEHTLQVEGIFEGELLLVSTYYVRESDAGAVKAVEVPEKETEKAEDGMPFPMPAPPPAAPLAGAPMGALPRIELPL